MSDLVIVESPTKAKTISKFLGKKFKIKSSFGHLRDLPKKKLGVSVDNDFQPEYVIPDKSKKNVQELKKTAAEADRIYFATDEDREGEAIAWHLAEIFGLEPKKTNRITFHEITAEAIKEALKNPRTIDTNLVNAQQARRILDRLVGYELSPFLWKKVAKGLSAGRVQSVTVRLIVEREREIRKFKPQEYWEIFGDFQTKTQEKLQGKLQKIKGKTLDKLAIGSEKEAKEITERLEKADFYIAKAEKKEVKKNPLPPFTTSTLQQEANRRLNFSAKQTMMIAQQLYEGIETNGQSLGLITYMRTDSVNLAKKFLAEAAEYLKQNLGPEYSKTKNYQTKSRGAQEAHEAIRPTEVDQTPEKLATCLNANQLKLYQLIWRRAVASQAAAAKLEATNIEINTGDDRQTFQAAGQVIKFDGFLKIYPASIKDELLPAVSQGDSLNCLEIKPIQKFTQPPARYSDAALVKALEKRGIGRPSTYAPTIATIIDRGYVERIDKKKLQPTEIAMVVNDLLVKHFSRIIDYDFTAEMEENLDKIAEGKKKWRPVIKEFYAPFKKNLTSKEKEITKKELTEEQTNQKCEKCGSPMVIKVGRFGKFLACSNYPECKNTKKLTDSKNNQVNPPKILEEKCPECGANLVLRKGRYGEFKGCSNYPKCRYIKKETSDLNLKCPKCDSGKIVLKRSRKGPFYGCDQYPKCDFAFWGKPSENKCSECGYPMIIQKNGEKCANKECSGNN